MPIELLDTLPCKFCGGALRLDLARKAKMPGFRFFRCEECELPNVFAAPAVRFIAPSDAKK